MKSKKAISLMMALMLSLLLISAASVSLYADPAPAYVDLDATQLDQLVAPIALDPDSLVAQVLTAATYPDQVGEADNWLNQNMNLPPDQRAAGANNMSWDPAVKGLIEFPSTLDNLAKNAAWTSQLGNAYYNQPGDVMNAVQAMRLQAQQSNTLVTTVQQRIVVEAGLIEIVPVNPAVVFVPYYNPWAIWGTLFVAYPGFVVLPPPPGIIVATGIAFDPAVALGVYAGFNWGFAAWAPAWDGGTVLFNHTTYISNSVTVFNHGYFGYHDRGVFEHGGRGVPHGFRACAHAGAARSAAGRSFAGRAGAGHSGFGKPSAGRSFGNHAAAAHANAGHSSFGNHAAANHATAANHGASANHATTSRGNTMANRGTAAGRSSAATNRAGSSASRGNATASRGATTNRGSSMASRGTSANRSSASASRGSSMGANRGAASASRGSAMGNRGAGSAGRGGSAVASRGAASGGRASGGGHASGGGRGGRGR
jgi:hypothetical protein